MRPRLSKRQLLQSAHAACRQDDPIYALIHAHREAWRQWSEAVHVEAGMYHYDPKMPAAEAEVERRADIKWSLLHDLNSARPLTIGGVAALAEYYGEIHPTCESELGDEGFMTALANIACVLRGMAVRS